MLSTTTIDVCLRGRSEKTRKNDQADNGGALSCVAQPAEIAEGIAFLASPAASFITGALVPAAGGYTAP